MTSLITSPQWLPALVIAVSLTIPSTTLPSSVILPSGAPVEGSRSAEKGTRTGHLPQGVRISERLFGLPGLSNVGRIAPAIYRGAQPQREGYETLRAMGIRTVINLRIRHRERPAVEAAGMRSIEMPMGTTSVNPDTVKRVVRLMTDPDNQPVFVHCAHGKDRTGVVVAVYRMEAEGWSNAEAEAEMQAFGFNDVWLPLKAFIREYPTVGGAPPRQGDRRRGMP